MLLHRYHSDAHIIICHHTETSRTLRHTAQTPRDRQTHVTNPGICQNDVDSVNKDRPENNIHNSDVTNGTDKRKLIKNDSVPKNQTNRSKTINSENDEKTMQWARGT